MIVTLIALTGLATLGAITVSSVQGGITSATSEKAHAIAIYAAEAGAMSAMDYLAPVYTLANHFSYVTRLSNINPEVPPGLPGNEKLPGVAGNVFSPEMQAWYRVTVLNNPTDPNFDSAAAEAADQEDSDGRINLLSQGFGPDGATATLEVQLWFDEPNNRFVVLSWREVE
ncbi:MAG: hypothetical protein R3B48_27320 [Kofleriaceae bacterium]